MKYPQYIITQDGYIGGFGWLDFGGFPVYRFDRGARIADEWEIKHGTDDYSEAVKIAKARKAERRKEKA